MVFHSECLSGTAEVGTEIDADPCFTGRSMPVRLQAQGSDSGRAGDLLP